VVLGAEHLGKGEGDGPELGVEASDRGVELGAVAHVRDEEGRDEGGGEGEKGDAAADPGALARSGGEGADGF
jgi:hypothetical protein